MVQSERLVTRANVHLYPQAWQTPLEAVGVDLQEEL